VACDAQNDVFIAGRGNKPGQGIQMLTMKLAGATGQILWSDFHGTTSGLDDVAWDVAVGPDGHPVVTGVSLDGSGGAVCVTRKLDAADGSLLWQEVLTGGVADLASPDGWLAILEGGDVAVCHKGYGAQSYDVLAARYGSADGAPVWTTIYDGPTHGGDNPRHMIADAQGNLLVAGVQDAFWNYDFMVLKFSGADGSIIWEAPGYDGPPGWYDVANRLAVGPGGVVIATGLSDGSGTGWDVATVGYDPDTGDQLWVQRHDGPAGQSDEGRDLALDPFGDLYVTGYAYGPGSGKDHLTLRYQLPLGSPALPPAPRLELTAPYPNPFNAATTMGIDLDGGQTVRLDVFDLQGAHVQTLHSGFLPAGFHAIRWDGRDDRGAGQSSGIYLFVLSHARGRNSEAAILVK